MNGFQDTGRNLTPVVRGLLAATIGAFVVQVLLESLLPGGFSQAFGLSLRGLRHGRLWQLVTYLLVHGSLAHLVLNMLGLYFIGPETERALGHRLFLALYLLSGALGGMGWLLISGSPWSICVGASGAVFGILGAFAALYPNRPLTLLVFFVLPVTMRAWVLVVCLALAELLFLLTSAGGGIANAAHLAGGVGGYFYTLAVVRRGPRRGPGRQAARERHAEARAAADQRELDRILDKIAAQGIGSLTPRERQFLDEASRRT